MGWSLAALVLAGAPSAAAQRIDLWLDATAAHAQPPGGVADAEPATYGILGARLGLEGRRFGALELLAHGGRSAEGGGGTWLDAALRGQAGGRLASLFLSGRAELFGLRYSDPFGYAAYGATIQPQAAWPVGRFSLIARGELTRGGWRVEEADSTPLPPVIADPTEPTTGGLSVTGGAFEIAYTLGRIAAQVGVETYHSESDGRFDGAYRGITGSVGYGTPRLSAQLGARAWRTPGGDELGYHAAAVVGLRPEVQLRLQVGRTVRDPLYGAAGSLTASVGVSWRVGSRTPAPPLRVAEVGDRVQGGRRVRFSIRAPSARTVALAGDFTGWEPRAMRRGEGATWSLEMVLEPGLHHFGFLVDGSRWTVPDDAPGVADDGWGRKNASIVVER